MMRKMPKEWKRRFPLTPPVPGIIQPVTSPVFEVRQFRKTKQEEINTLDPGTLIRFVVKDVNGPRVDGGLPLYTISFVIERLEDGNWVKCSQTLDQYDLAERIIIVPDEDGDDPTIFNQFPFCDQFHSWERPLMVLVPHETR